MRSCRTITRLFTVAVVFLALVPATIADSARKVGPVPDELRKRWKLRAFYEKHVDLQGFPILGSSKVSDHALLEAAYVIERMLAGRGDVLRHLVKEKVRCCVMAYTELTTDVPEHMSLEPGKYWDRRARGLGASPERPCISCAEENLLGFPGDPYATESILVHEFAHAIDIMGLRRIDTRFEMKLQKAYRAAMKAGLWKGLYAAENKEEYWAEGVQSWFDTNRPPDSIHNHVNTREELEAYDPRLAKLIEKAFPGNDWRYVHPRNRKERAHLKDFDASKAPRFRWPPELDAWYRRYEKAKRTGAGRVEIPPVDAGKAPPRSPYSLDETRILFMNRTKKVLEIFWLDHEGKRKSYGIVNPGKNAERSTLVGHVWLLADEQTGLEVARFVASTKPGRAVIRIE